MTVVVAVAGGVGCGGAVVDGAVTIVAAEEDDEGPRYETNDVRLQCDSNLLGTTLISQ